MTHANTKIKILDISFQSLTKTWEYETNFPSCSSFILKICLQFCPPIENRGAFSLSDAHEWARPFLSRIWNLWLPSIPSCSLYTSYFQTSILNKWSQHESIKSDTAKAKQEKRYNKEIKDFDMRILKRKKNQYREYFVFLCISEWRKLTNSANYYIQHWRIVAVDHHVLSWGQIGTQPLARGRWTEMCELWVFRQPGKSLRWPIETLPIVLWLQEESFHSLIFLLLHIFFK